MAEVHLPPIRIGFAYSVSLTFPTGFLAANESVRAKLRRYASKQVPDAVFSSSRTGDVILLELTPAQTDSLEPGEHLTEAVVYQPTSPGAAEIPILDTIFVINVAHSPSF